MVLTETEKEKIFESMFNENLRLLGLYSLRLHYLETRNENLELCRVLRWETPLSERDELVKTYTDHFKRKIESIIFDLNEIKKRNPEYIEDFVDLAAD